MGFRSNEEYLFFELADPSIEFSVARMRGEEGISSLFEFQVELVSEDNDIEFDEVVGQGCVISLEDHNHVEEDGKFTDEASQTRFFHGIVSQFEIAEEGARFTTYYATVVPKIWLMKHRENCRIFQEQGVKDIVTTLLDELGLEPKEFKWDCNKTYQAYDYCVQYRESEFNFISRLLEQEGIFYYFEHTDEGHTVIFHDDSTIAEALEEDEIPVIKRQQGLVSNQHIYSVKQSKSLTPGKVTIRDFNFSKPKMNLHSEKVGSEKTDKDRELYQYPGKFEDKSRGDFLAAVKLRAANTFKESISCKSNVNMLTPGYSFFLADDKIDKDFLIVKIEHVAIQAQAYQEDSTTAGGRYNNRFVGIPLDVPFTTPIQSRMPLVEGTQTAIVTGPSGEEIYTDEHGRVKVQFHWDREGEANEDSSCWIRVSQMWAGSNYGGFMLPRIGQEVIVDFLDGNPDKPIITGRVHHGDNRAPYPLPDKKTVSTLKTNSSPDGGGFNELRFEDKAGEEQIFIHAEKDKDLRVKNDSREWVGNDSHSITIGNHYSKIEKEKHATIVGDSYLQIEGETHQTHDGSVLQTLGADLDIDVKGMRKASVNAEHLTAKMDINQKAGMNYGIDAGMKIDAKAGMTINMQAGLTINLKAGPSFVSIGPSGVMISGPMVMINSGGAAGPANPKAPSKPKSAKAPEEAIESADDKAGKVEKVKSKAKPRPVSTYGPQAKALLHAAESGVPFCEECEAAKKKESKGK